MITPLWSSGSWRSFLYSSSLYICYLFLISSASVRSVSFLSFIEPIFAWNVPLVSPIFLNRACYFSLKNSPRAPGCFALKYLGAHSFPCDLLLCYGLTGMEIRLLSNQIGIWVVTLESSVAGLQAEATSLTHLLNLHFLGLSFSLLTRLSWEHSHNQPLHSDLCSMLCFWRTNLLSQDCAKLWVFSMCLIGNDSNATQIINDMKRSQGYCKPLVYLESLLHGIKKAISTVDKGFKKDLCDYWVCNLYPLIHGFAFSSVSLFNIGAMTTWDMRFSEEL